LRPINLALSHLGRAPKLPVISASQWYQLPEAQLVKKAPKISNEDGCCICYNSSQCSRLPPYTRRSSSSARWFRRRTWSQLPVLPSCSCSRSGAVRFVCVAISLYIVVPGGEASPIARCIGCSLLLLPRSDCCTPSRQHKRVNPSSIGGAKLEQRRGCVFRCEPGVLTVERTCTDRTGCA
jgi:hypothetical protein